MRFFLAAHRHGSARCRIPQPRLLDDAPAVFNQLNLPLDLVFERLFQVTEGVDVLHFGFRPEPLLPCRANRHVRIAAKAPLFHVAVIDAKPDQDVAEPLEELRGFRCGAHIRLGDDLNQRHAASVVVDIRCGGPNPESPHAETSRHPPPCGSASDRRAWSARQADVEPTVKGERPFVL
jgi:hypothetical protein